MMRQQFNLYRITRFTVGKTIQDIFQRAIGIFPYPRPISSVRYELPETSGKLRRHVVSYDDKVNVKRCSWFLVGSLKDFLTKLSEYSLKAPRNVSNPPTILFDLSCILLLFQLSGHGHQPMITPMTGGRRSDPRSKVRISKSLSAVNLRTH